MYRFEVTALAGRISPNVKTEDKHSVPEVLSLQDRCPGFIEKRDHESRASRSAQSIQHISTLIHGYQMATTITKTEACAHVSSRCTLVARVHSNILYNTSDHRGMHVRDSCFIRRRSANLLT